MKQALDYIRVQNSFAHRDTRVDFKAGRNYIIGNYGSGKSELIEMIGFAFFGTVSLRGKASTYPKLEVELQFNHYGNKFLIKRRTGDASLYLFDQDLKKFSEVATSTTGVNNKIISLLGYDYNIYLLSNYCQQGKLQYFSELTPAKRLQFIDKVSGIEDAKELVDWLNTRRKTLKNTLDTLKDMIQPPELNSNVDLEVDYEELIANLVLDTSKINELNKEIRDLRSNHYKDVPAAPREVTPILQSYARVSDEVLKNLDERLIEFEDLQETCQKLIDTRDSLLKCPAALRKVSLTLKEAELLLNQIMMNSLTTTDITCPDCEHVFSTSVLKDTSHELSHVSVKDLSNYIAWLQPDIQQQYSELNQNIDTLLERIDLLRNEDVVLGIRLCQPEAQRLSGDVRRAREVVTDFETITESRQQALEHNKGIDSLINTVQSQLDNLLEEQTEHSKLRSEYVAKRVEKDLYLKQYDIYLEAKSRFNETKVEFEIIQTLIKEINEITSKIKLETIPLINHHASNYLNTMTKGVMTDIQITENYDLIVDGFQISLRSGAQKDLSSLAFRLSLGQSIILGMLPLFIGDEIDASSPTEVANDITTALETMSDKGYQMIMITHKDISNLENCNIIDLG